MTVTKNLSEVFVIMFTLSKNEKSIRDFVIAFVNGALVFISASGINAISTGMAFINSSNNINKTNVSNTKIKESSLIPYTNEIAWWPELRLVEENIYLRKEVVKLKEENANLTLKNADKEKVIVIPKQKKIISLKPNITVKNKGADEIVTTTSNAKLSYQDSIHKALTLSKNIYTVKLSAAPEFEDISNVTYVVRGTKLNAVFDKNIYQLRFTSKSDIKLTDISILVSYKNGTSRVY